MKKIVSMTLYSDPRCQGGIEAFNRNLKKIYPDNLIMITEKTSKPKIYELKDVIEVGSENIFFRALNNRILRNKLKEYLILKKVKKNIENMVIFSFPHEVFLLKDIEAKKIMVQHTSFEHFIKEYCKNRENFIEIIKKTIDYFVVLSPYEIEKFKLKFHLDKKKVKVIRHSSNIELLKTKKEKNKKLIMIGRIDNNSKRFDLAIRAMKKLPDFTLDIYGGIYNQKDINFLKKIIRDKNINNVFFRGITNEVQEKLDESGIYIMTSDYEGYGIVNIEAMRRGLPIVLRNTFDSAQDIVIDNGVLLEKEWDEDKFVEAVKKVYDNYEYYSENSKKLGERHSPEVIKQEWDKLFKEIEIEEKN